MIPSPIPPVLRSWLGWKASQEANPDYPLVDLELVTLVRRTLYVLDECFPAWDSNTTKEVLDYLYRRCELSTFLYTRVACQGSIGATPPLTTGPAIPITPPTLTITSFTSTSPVNLLGSQLSGVSLLWSYNRQEDGQQVGGVAQPQGNRSYTLTGTITSTSPTTYTLTGTLGSQVERATTSLQFVNQLLVGVGLPHLLDLSELTALPLTYPETRAFTTTLTASPTQKVYLAFPLRLGASPSTPTAPQAIYKVGDFEGGFRESIIRYTNPAGYTEDYVVAESVNVNLGTITVSVL